MIAILATIVLFCAAALKLIASLRLLHGYRVSDYLKTPASRSLYTLHILMPVVMGAAILTLAYSSNLWWVEVPAWLILGFTIWHSSRAAYMRLSGRYEEHYKAHQWK